MTIEIEDLRVFLAVAEHGSFGRAASALGLAQPSVSNRMAALERRIGGPLFNRSTRGASLAPAGERLLPHARRALQVVEDAQAAARTTHYRPPIRVLLSASYTPVLLPAVVDAFEGHERPLSVSYDHGHNIVRAIATGEADIGFLAPCPHPTTVTLRSLGSSPVVAVVAPGHPLVRRRRRTFAGLGDYPIAFSSWGEGADVFLEHLPGPARLCTIFPVSAAAQLARDRGYVALAPQAALAADLRSETLTQLPISDMPTATVPFAIAFHRTGTIAVTDLIAHVRHALRAPSAHLSQPRHA
jgi:LysR family transcriptional regulator, putative pyruvate carboxylase regulator